MNPNFNARIAVLFMIIAGVITLSLYKTRPPAVVPASAPEAEFSAERAMVHMAAISQEPHMTGSLEIYKVRDYILAVMGDLGLEAEVQTTLAQNPLREDEIALVENIIARIPGTGSSQGILYIGHYDSAPHSPGAGDDGVAVGVMIETVRALKAGPPLKNDVILLFSDAEESTIGGANAARKHPWLSEVGLVINLEMRGSSGPVYMFETGPENGLVIPELAESIPYPATSSLMRDVYTNMPNNTDFTAYRDAGYAGFNFSVLEGSTTYHTPRDLAENIDLRSVQHHGSNTLGIARHFGDIELNNLKAEDAVYFDILGSVLVHYPGFLSIPLVVLALLLFMGLVFYGFRREKLTFKGIGQGFLAFLAVLVSGPGFVTLLWFGIRAVANPPMISGDTYNSPAFFLGFGLLITAITAALYNLFFRKVNTANLAVGALAWWIVFLLGITFIFPKANFFFLWPLAFAISGVAFWIFSEEETLTWTGVAVLSLAALAGLLIVPPTTYSVLMGLVAVVSLTGVGMVLLSFLLGLLVPHFSAMTWSESGLGRWWLSAGLGSLGVLVLIFALATIRVDADHPRLFQLIYALDTETGEAVWASVQSSEYNEEWTAQFFSEGATDGPLPQFFGGDRPQFKIDQAPVATLPLPEIDMLENSREGGIRKIRLSIASTGRANQARFYIDPPVEVLSVALNGEQLKLAEDSTRLEEPWTLAYFGPLTTPIELNLEIRAEGTITMRVVEVSLGLPEFPEMSYSPLPDYLVAFSCFCRDDSRMTYISSSLTFE
jgi:Zn-dependent M28 family amino/carboxypeptidase